MTDKNSSPEQRSVFYTKQPILDAKRSIWGYELLGGEIHEGIYEIFPQRESSASLAYTTFWRLQDAMARGKKIMVGLDGKSILAGVPYALPPPSGVIRVLAAAARLPELPSALQALRKDGYLVALEVTPDLGLSEEMHQQADILAVDVSGGIPDPLTLERMGGHSFRMLARGVKTLEQFQASKESGFALFQGAFFKEAETVRDRKLGSSVFSRLNLMRLWECEDPDFHALAEAISYDVAISFRLLTYLNSPYFGIRFSVQSIDQAIMLLGWDKLRNWLRAVIIVDLTANEEGPQELAMISLQRGKFFELLATEYDYWGFAPNTLFLIGLFSLLDGILGMPMEAVVEMLPFDAKLKEALRRDPGSEYAPLFRLLECLEDADWPALEILTRKLCLDLGAIKDSFAVARDWASGFYSSPG